MADHRGNIERHYLHTRLPFTLARPDCNAFVALADPATQTEPLAILRGLTERAEVQSTENTFAIELVSEIANLALPKSPSMGSEAAYDQIGSNRGAATTLICCSPPLMEA